ncbi:MAG TPA: phosphate ABC transporter substrate-binding protein [Candidatus Bathyarchaeia archaeon]|nr:phosphate ABC transporter substrate-binding protein [Candidatus Bathyarchaeia archaeon]
MPFNKQKRNTIILIILIPVAAVFGGIISWSNVIKVSQYELNIEGSTTAYKIVENLSKEFSVVHQSVQISVTGTDSSSGITALIEGLIDIAMSSRPVTSLENLSADDSLKSIPIAKDVLAIIVNENANPFNISIDGLRAIFNGTISDWSNPLVSAAGLIGPIQVVVREMGSGSRNFFNDFVMEDVTQTITGSSYVETAIEKTSNQLMLDAVANNENYIGYLGLGFLTVGVNSLGVENITPSIETIEDESYPLQRELLLVIKNIPTENLMINEFINWALSPNGQKIVEEMGFVPIAKIIVKVD